MPTVTVIQPKITESAERIIRVAAYCRVSSSSDDQLNSYNSQIQYYSHLFDEIETETLVDIYADEGITGTCEAKRTEFLRLIEDCRKGKIDRVYTKSISRFARNTRDCLKNIRELKSLGITVIFEKENIDTAKINDELMITVLGSLAQEESVSISQNVQWSIRRRMQKGTFKASSLPYGYAKENGEIIIVEEEAEIVRYIFSSYLSGSGMGSITQTLNTMLKKGVKGYDWCRDAVKYILTNEKYTGDAIYQKKYTANVFPYQKKRNKGERDMYFAEEVMPQIISHETFETAQKIHQKAALINGHDGGSTYTFSGKIKCSVCGSSYSRKKMNGSVRWICIKHITNASLCESRPTEEEHLESAFITLFNKLYINYKEIFVPIKNSLQELEVRQAVGNKNIVEIRRNILQFKEQKKVLSELRTKGFLTEVKYKEQATEIETKINKLSKEIRLLSKNDDTLIKEIELLISYFEKREKLMIEFEVDAFDFLVDKMVTDGNMLEFHIMGGLVFTEKL